uniref:Uncharacterized protein n=1 Tax=Plectus sambesii TaxID=2011161 RepID=A0A914WA81_9BILA
MKFRSIALSLRVFSIHRHARQLLTPNRAPLTPVASVSLYFVSSSSSSLMSPHRFPIAFWCRNSGREYNASSSESGIFLSRARTLILFIRSRRRLVLGVRIARASRRRRRRVVCCCSRDDTIDGTIYAGRARAAAGTDGSADRPLVRRPQRCERLLAGGVCALGRLADYLTQND